MVSRLAGNRDTSNPLRGLAALSPQAMAANDREARKKMCFSFAFIARKVVAPTSGFFHFTAQTYGKGIYLAIHRTKFSINIFLGNYLVWY